MGGSSLTKLSPKICNPSAAHGTLVVATVTGTGNSYLVDHLGNSLSKAILFPNVFKLHHTKLTGPWAPNDIFVSPFWWHYHWRQVQPGRRDVTNARVASTTIYSSSGGIKHSKEWKIRVWTTEPSRAKGDYHHATFWPPSRLREAMAWTCHFITWNYWSTWTQVQSHLTVHSGIEKKKVKEVKNCQGVVSHGDCTC